MYRCDDCRCGFFHDDGDFKYEDALIAYTRSDAQAFPRLGHNRVEIAPNEREDDESDDGQSDENSPTPKSGKPKIPARYNTKSELEADVKPGENVFDFELESKLAGDGDSPLRTGRQLTQATTLNSD